MSDKPKKTFSVFTLLSLLTAAGAITHSAVQRYEHNSQIEQHQLDRLEMQNVITNQAVEIARMKSDLAHLEEIRASFDDENRQSQVELKLGEMEFIRRHREKHVRQTENNKSMNPKPQGN